MKPERMIELAKQYGIRTLESIFPNPAYANAGNVRERELEIFANAVIEESTSELQKEVERLTQELDKYKKAGCKLVPIEPTVEMIRFGHEMLVSTLGDDNCEPEDAESCYQHMVEAAPTIK